MSSEQIAVVDAMPARSERPTAQLASLGGETLSEELDRVRDELTERTADLEMARDALRRNDHALAESRASVAALTKELEAQRRRADSLEEQLSATEPSSAFRKVKELTEVRDMMLEELELARAELDLHATRTQQTEVEYQGLHKQLLEVEGENRRLQRELGELIDRVFEQEDLLADADAGALSREVQRLREEIERQQDSASADASAPAAAATDDEIDHVRSEVERLEHELLEVWAELDDVARARDVAREEAFELEALRRELGQLQRNRDELAGQVEEQRAKIRELSERSDGADSESFEREMAVARQLIDGLEQQCQRAESRAAAYKTELVEVRAINSDLRTRLSAVGRRLSAGRGRSRSRDLSDR